jgi:hypothetical protein
MYFVDGWIFGFYHFFPLQVNSRKNSLYIYVQSLNLPEDYFPSTLGIVMVSLRLSACSASAKEFKSHMGKKVVI